jgi:hypothetical protein
MPVDDVARIIFCAMLAGCGGIIEVGAQDSGTDRGPPSQDAQADLRPPPRKDSGHVGAEGGDADDAPNTAVCLGDAASTWRVVPTPSGGIPLSFGGVWGSGQDDVWAVGDAIHHWNGSAWSISPTPTGEAGYFQLTGVWGSGAADVWVVGADTGDGALVLHWNGTAWSLSPTPTNPYYYNGYYGGGTGLATVWGSGPKDVWAAGAVSPYSTGAPILHWDGTAWTYSSIPTASTVSGLWGSASDDVWATGLANGTPDAVLLHWDGHTWTESFKWSLPTDAVYYPPYYAGCGYHCAGLGNWSYANTLAGVWGSGPGDVWAAGTQCFLPQADGGGGSATCTPDLFHWDGVGWSSSIEPGSSVSSLWGTGSCDVWAVGADSDGGPLVLHRDCSTWSPSRVPAGVVGGLDGVWGSGCEVWAVGSEILFH